MQLLTIWRKCRTILGGFKGMNTYTFEDCQIGKKESFETELTEKKMEILNVWLVL